MEWLQKLGGNREGCFLDPGGLKVDASVVCHEARCPELEKGDSLWFSVKDIRIRDREQMVNVGQTIDMKSLQLDSTLLVRIWAGKNDSPERVCGELRIPVEFLIRRENTCLYYRWITLDSPGLDASVRSMNVMAAQSDAEAFETALQNGPKLLSSPGVCVSIVKTSLLPSSGSIMWTEDMKQEMKLQFWPCLLRSHQQHLLMCQAQKFQSQSSQGKDSSPDVDTLQEELRGMHAKLKNTASSLEVERQSLMAQRDQFREEQRNSVTNSSVELVRIREKMAELAASETQLQAQVQRLTEENLRLSQGDQSKNDQSQARSQVERLAGENRELRETSDRQNSEIESLMTKLEEVSVEANRKIGEANDRIRALKSEKEDIKQENDMLRSHNSSLENTVGLEVQGTQEIARLVAELKVFEERDVKRVADIEKLRSQVQANEQKEAELENLKGALDSVCQQGKQRMGSMTDQVRDLVKEREDLAREREQFRQKWQKACVENQQLGNTMSGLQEEHSALQEQRDALMKIVEDLHAACESANPDGSDSRELQELGRASIRSIRNFKQLTPRGNTPRGLSPRVTPRDLM